MKTLVLLSILVGLIAIPLRAARMGSPRRAASRVMLQLLFLSVFYLVALRFIYPRLL